MWDNSIIKKVEKVKDRVVSIQKERSYYLGELKEKVILALTKEEIEEKYLYPEFRRALMLKKANKVIILRDINRKSMMRYFCLAKCMKISCTLVDSLSYMGNVGLVVVSKESLDSCTDPVVKSFKQRILDAGLDEVYYSALGKKISPKYYKIIEEKLPELVDLYKEMTIWDKIFGYECPIAKKLEY